MTDRQFLWGLSNGVVALAIAGTFWIGYGFGPHLAGTGWVVPTVFSVLLYGTLALLVWQALRLKRKAGFKRSKFKQADERQRAETRKLMRGFVYIGAAQAVLVAAAVLLCLRLGHEELLGPSIGLIVSLHFIPLGRIFHVPTYYVVGIVGSAISIIAFSPMFGAGRMMFLGGTMGVQLWFSAVYILWRAERISAKAVGERWRG